MKERRKETEVVRVCKGDAFEYFKTFAGKSHVKQILVSHMRVSRPHLNGKQSFF